MVHTHKNAISLIQPILTTSLSDCLERWRDCMVAFWISII